MQAYGRAHAVYSYTCMSIEVAQLAMSNRSKNERNQGRAVVFFLIFAPFDSRLFLNGGACGPLCYTAEVRFVCSEVLCHLLCAFYRPTF